MYWYNLYFVLVVEHRARVADLDCLLSIRDGCLKIATKKGHAIAALSVMLDRLHAVLRGDHRRSPLETSLTFQNNLACVISHRLWLSR